MEQIKKMLTTFVECRLHPDLRGSTNKSYKRSIIAAYISIAIMVFYIPFTLYFYISFPLTYHQNILSNFGYLAFFIFFILLRFTKNINYPLIFLSAASLPLVYVSVYKTGGLYSYNLIWAILSMACPFFIITKRVGVIMCLLHTIFIFSLYFFDASFTRSESPFVAYTFSVTPLVYAANFVFVLLLIALILYIFIGTLESLNNRLEMLTKNRIDDLNKELSKVKKDMANMRENISKDFHDEMGNKLASISIISQTLRHKLIDNSNVEINNSITEIDQLSKELYTGTRDFIWSIKWDNDNLSNLLEYLREFGERFFNNLNINYSASHIEPKFHEIILNPEINRQLILICKEIFTNVAKHAQCTGVIFTCWVEEGKICFKIVDNGIGFNTLKITSKNGISNIKYRAQKIGAHLIINSKENEGSEYSIWLKKIEGD
jgi:signal transduction histidine kinase